MPIGHYQRGKFSFSEGFTLRVLKADVDKCWIWNGERTTAGYGRFRGVYAHRASWEIENGQIPYGMHVLHRCDNPPCVNPNHLYLGTDTENRRDARERERYPGNGRSSRCKLSEREVVLIKAIQRSVKDGVSREKLSHALASSFPHVSRYTIRCVLQGTNWSHITL